MRKRIKITKWNKIIEEQRKLVIKTKEISDKKDKSSKMGNKHETMKKYNEKKDKNSKKGIYAEKD